MASPLAQLLLGVALLAIIAVHLYAFAAFDMHMAADADKAWRRGLFLGSLCAALSGWLVVCSALLHEQRRGFVF